MQPYGSAGGFAPQGPQPWQQSAQAGYATDRVEVDGAVQAVAWVLAVLSFGYMLPWAVAASRGRPNHGVIALINVLLGWSFIGWIVALVMACESHRPIGPGPMMNVVLAQQFPHAQFTGPPPPMQTGPPAGWYPAPSGSGQQYWDGTAWTGNLAP